LNSAPSEAAMRIGFLVLFGTLLVADGQYALSPKT
jgi:hypothetical protein